MGLLGSACADYFGSFLVASHSEDVWAAPCLPNIENSIDHLLHYVFLSPMWVVRFGLFSCQEIHEKSI